MNSVLTRAITKRHIPSSSAGVFTQDLFYKHHSKKHHRVRSLLLDFYFFVPSSLLDTYAIEWSGKSLSEAIAQHQRSSVEVEVMLVAAAAVRCCLTLSAFLNL